MEDVAGSSSNSFPDVDAIMVALREVEKDVRKLHQEKLVPLVKWHDNKVVLVNPFTLEIMADGEEVKPPTIVCKVCGHPVD